MNRSLHDTSGATPLERRMTQFQALSLSDVAFWVRKWKWEFLFVVLSTLAATLVYIMVFRDPVFVSEARLFVRLSQEQTAPRTLITQAGTTLLTPGTSDVTSEIDLFLNSDIASDVIDRAGLLDALETPPPPPDTVLDRLKAGYKTVVGRVRDATDEVSYALGIKVRLTPREALIRQIRTSLGVENSRQSNVVVVSIKWPDRDVPKALLQEYLDAFMKFRIDAFQSDETEYFERQVDASHDRVAALEARIAALRTSSGIEDVTIERENFIGAREAASASMRAAKLILDQVQARNAALAGRDGPDGPLLLAGLPDNPTLQLLDERSIAVRDEWQRARFEPSLDGMNRASLDEAFRSLSATTRQSLQDYEARVAADLASARSEVASLDGRLATLSANEAEWKTLQSEVTLAGEAYEDNARRLSEARGAERLRTERISNVVVIQQPTDAHLATGTRNAVVLTVGGVFALLFAASWVVLREALDARVWRAGDLAGATSVPLLGVTRRRGRRKAGRDLQVVGSTLAAICRRQKIRSLAVMSVRHACADPAGRTRGLAAGLAASGVTGVEIVNAGRWSAGRRSGAADPSIPERRADPASLPFHASGSDRPDGGLQLIAAAPLFSGVDAMTVARSADAVVLEVEAGADDLADVEAAMRWLELNGVRAIGTILADAPSFSARGPVATT